MVVCAHGEVTEFCENNNMVIAGSYVGDIEDYAGMWPVLVTDEDMDENSFFELKLRMLRRGVELVSTRYHSDKLSSFVSYVAERHKPKHGGRARFGFRRVGNDQILTEGGLRVAMRIFELRDKGYTLKEISADEAVHHPDGRTLSTSTIQQVLKNRKRYEDGSKS